jgi:hypothetical protein
MTKPSIHLNGTSAQSLADDLRTAGDALYTALSAVNACVPNPRDYYPQGPNAFASATAEHAARLRLLEKVCDELAELYAHVLNYT